MTLSFIKSRFDESLLTRILLPIGNASYSLYLTHEFGMIFYASLLKYRELQTFPSPLLLTLAAVVACTLVGLLTYHFIERPTLVRMRSLLNL